jgi:hypothetical protein
MLVLHSYSYTTRLMLSKVYILELYENKLLGRIFELQTKRRETRKCIISNITICNLHCHFFSHGLTDLLGLGFLIVDYPRSHSDTPHSVGHLWTSDQPDAETST